jgi:hypothetical protein
LLPAQKLVSADSGFSVFRFCTNFLFRSRGLCWVPWRESCSPYRLLPFLRPVPPAAAIFFQLFASRGARI